MVSKSVLYRANTSDIRKAVLKDDILGEIIALPKIEVGNNQKYRMIFNNNKEKERKNKVQLIKGKEMFKEDGRDKYITGEMINTIVDTYKNGKHKGEFSQFITIEEIERHNWDLNGFEYLKMEAIKKEFGDMIKLKDVLEK